MKPPAPTFRTQSILHDHSPPFTAIGLQMKSEVPALHEFRAQALTQVHPPPHPRPYAAFFPGLHRCITPIPGAVGTFSCGCALILGVWLLFPSWP